MKKIIVLTLLCMAFCLCSCSVETRVIPVVCFFNSNGEIIQSTPINNGVAVSLPNDPTKEPDDVYNYTFIGWDADEDGKPDKAKMNYSDNTNLYPVFKKDFNKYVVQFYDSDCLLETKVVNYGEDAFCTNMTTNKSISGKDYSFVGWDKLTTKVTCNLNVYAIYELK